ncbi:hypothetical protein J2Y54_003198 [Sphingomonas sp. BE123]|jgi:hypothetical protein|uniref:hypothetical protein n=1 Tax=unclassified Sphingomonas TaxID=196159 RepID=UPI00286785AD|nr:hypothetical protein [Sphingomonas sp. BE123]MDR6853678.1 hypothetical protein [Sphingomonas sp. BE123]
MMRDNGFFGLLHVIYACSREGWNRRHAWTVMAVIALILCSPALLLGLLGWIVLQVV